MRIEIETHWQRQREANSGKDRGRDKDRNAKTEIKRGKKGLHRWSEIKGQK